MNDWNSKLECSIDFFSKSDDDRAKFLRANANSVKRTLAGKGPDSDEIDKEGAFWVVFNISSVHIPSFCSENYKNTYDLAGRLGDSVSSKRLKVDKALADAFGHEEENIYFGAIELNGSGIRFYGDFCLVLNKSEVSADTTILDRNSYDILREPLVNMECPTDGDEVVCKVRSISGTISSDLENISAIKVIELNPISNRRLSAGQISDSILIDEDYIEVLREESFGIDKLFECRLSASDVALELKLSNQAKTQNPPSCESLLWLDRRQQAEAELSQRGCSIRVISSTSRVKG